MKAKSETKETRKRTVTGVAVSRSGDKTVAIQVVRTLRHPLYGKSIKRTKKYLAHDEKNEVVVGDTVTIQESRPLSARKRWIVISKNSK